MIGWMVGVESGVAKGVDGCVRILSFADLEDGCATDRVSIRGYRGELLSHALALKTYSVGFCEYWLSS